MSNPAEFFECQCRSEEHLVKLVLDEEEPEIYVSIFLCDYQSWWERALTAIKYFFGYTCKYGHWDSFILRGEDVPRLRAVLDRYEAIKAQRALEAAKPE